MESKYHYTIEVINQKNSKLKIGSIVHTEKEKNDRINELLNEGFSTNDIKTSTYYND